MYLWSMEDNIKKQKPHPVFQAETKEHASSQEQPDIQLPEGVSRVDFIIIERSIHTEGGIGIAIRVDSTDPTAIPTINSFDIAGTMEAAKNTMLNSTLKSR
jgi:hypothetical protein